MPSEPTSCSRCARSCARPRRSRSGGSSARRAPSRRSRSSTVSTGSPPRSASDRAADDDPLRARASPSWFSQPGRPCRRRARSGCATRGSAARASVASAPPSCAQPGSSPASSVDPAPYGYWSNVAPAALDELEQRLDQRLVGERLEVREVQRRARALRDLDHLAAPPRARRGPRCARAGRAARRTRPRPRRPRRARRCRRTRPGCRRARTRACARPPRTRARTSRRIASSAAARVAADEKLAHRAVRRPTGRASIAGRVASSASRYSAKRRPRPLRRAVALERAQVGAAARASRATGAGASPSGQITSVVKPCSTFGVSSGSSNGASAECACRSMKPGQSIAPAASSDLALEPLADRRDLPVGDADVRAERRAVARVRPRRRGRRASDERRACRRRRRGSAR